MNHEGHEGLAGTSRGQFGQRQTAAPVVLFAIYLLVASLRIDSGDGETIYQVSRALIEGRGFAIPPPPADAVVVDPFGEPIPPEQLDGGGPYGAWGRDGRCYEGIGQSRLALPFHLARLACWRPSGWGTAGFVTRAAVMLLNLLALVVAVLGALRGEEGRVSEWLLCGAALGGAALVKPATLAVAPIFALYILARAKGRWQALLGVSGPLGAAIVVTVLVHPARALQTLYDRAASPTDYTLRLLYRPADSPLVGQWRSLLEVAALIRSPAARQAVIETARAAAQESSDDPLIAAAGYLAFNAFDLWPAYWAMPGAPWLPLLAVEAGLAAAAAWAARRLRRGDV